MTLQLQTLAPSGLNPSRVAPLLQDEAEGERVKQKMKKKIKPKKKRKKEGRYKWYVVLELAGNLF